MTRVWQGRAYRDSRTRGAIKLHLRWTDRPAEATTGRWQVTTLEPSSSTTDWEHPPGFVAAGNVGRLPVSGEFDISFMPGPPEGVIQRGGSASRAEPAVAGAPATSRRMRSPSAARTPNIAAVARAVLKPMLDPNRFFIRVVGLDAAGRPAGPPSTPIVLDWTLPSTFEGKIPTAEQVRKQAAEAAKKVAAARPARLSLSFEPTREAAGDAHYRYVVTQDFMAWKKGQKIKLKPKSDSWLDDVGDALGDAADFVEDSVNWVSNGWKDIKAFAIDAVADQIPGCAAACRMGLAAGLDAGLAAMGVPPSIPNFDQLAQAGKGYLVQTLAEQATEATGAPVPPEAVEAVVDRVYEAAKKHADGGGSRGAGWLRPDPDFMYRPPIATITITSQSTTVVPPSTLVVEFHRLYYIKAVPLPPIPPGGRLDVPVVLDPPAWDAWLPTISEERRKAGSHVLVSMSDLVEAWAASYRGERNTLSAGLTKVGDPTWRTIAYTSASFVAADGYHA